MDETASIVLENAGSPTCYVSELRAELAVITAPAQEPPEAPVPQAGF